MAYIGSRPSTVVSRQSVVDYRFTAVEGQTVFTGADNDNQVLRVNPADTTVYLNGVRLDPTDWSSDALTITLAVAATAGDEVTVTVRQTFEVADTYAKTTADDRFVNASGDTLTGTLNLPDNTAMIRRASNAEWVMGFDATNNILSIGTLGGATANRLQLCSGGNKIAIEADGSGRVTMPYQPLFEAEGGTAHTNYGSGVRIFTGVRVNQGGHYSATTGRFTAPIAGKYFFYANFDYLESSTGAAPITIRKNGTWHTQHDHHDWGTGWMNHNLQAIISLAEGDYVDVTTGAAYIAMQNWSNFGGYLIG